MKKILLLLVAVSLLPAFVQEACPQNIEGQIIAAQYGTFQVPTVGNGFSFPPATCQIPAGGKNFAAFTANVPIKIVDTNPSYTEVVTPVAAFVNDSTCSVSMTPTFAHSSFYLTSGTGGLQEAINNGQVYGTANTVVLDQQWYSLITPRSAATVIGSVAGNTTIGLVDVTTAPYTNYTWNGSQYVATGGGGGGGLPTGTGLVKVVNGVGTLAAPAVDYSYPQATGNISVMDPNYGGVCNWNGTTGTDDTVAFNAAAAAAHATYVATGSPVEVDFPQGCTLGTGSGNSTVTWPSGVYWKGGSIFVPVQSAVEVFKAVSADDIAFLGGTITMVSNGTGCGPSNNNAQCAAIRYDSANPGTTTTHKNVYIHNVTIVNSGWGILIGPQAGTDLLSNIILTDNKIIETQQPITSYQYADGIHLGGAVSSFVVANNVVSGRGDAGIAVTSEFSTVLRSCQDGVITGNTLYEDREGIDVSGCSSVQITGNWVWADIAVHSSNPAFRAITYPSNGQLPHDLNVVGNVFVNYQDADHTTDNSAKFDCAGGGATNCGTSGGAVAYYNSSFKDNSTINLYMRGSGIFVEGNTFLDYGNGASLTADWDTTHVVGSYDIVVGPNVWRGSGKITAPNRFDIFFGSYLAPQTLGNNAVITYTNGQMWGRPDALYDHLTLGYFGTLGFSGDNTGPGSGVGAPDTYLTRLAANSLGIGSTNGGSNGTINVGAVVDSGLTPGNCVQAGATTSTPVGTANFPCPKNAPPPTTIPTTSGGFTYYVDNVNGADSNAGTSATAPWKTINKVNTFPFGSGPTVLFLAGDVWHEQLVASVANMTIGAYGPQRSCLLSSELSAHCTNMPIIDGADAVTGWTLVTGTTYSSPYTATASKGFVDSLYRQTTPLALQTSLPNVEATPGSIFSNGTLVYVNLADGSNPTNHVMEISGTRSYGINLNGFGFNTVTGMEIIRTNLSGIFSQGAGTNNVFRNNVLFNNNSSLTDSNLGLQGGGAITAVAGFTATNVTGYQFIGNWIGQMDYPHAMLNFSSAGLFMAGLTGPVATGNKIAAGNGIGMMAGDWFTAIPQCSSAFIQGNEFVNSEGNVFIRGCVSSIVEGNYIHNSFGNAVEAGPGISGSSLSTGLYLNENTVIHLRSAYSNGLYNGFDINYVANGIATNNNISDVAQSSMTLEADTAPSGGWQIYGNTFDASQDTYVDGTACSSSNRCFSMYVRNSSLSGGLTMRANTMVGNAASTVLVRWGATSASDSTHDLTQTAFDAAWPNYEIGGTIGNFSQINVGASAPTACSPATGCLGLGEGTTAGTPTAGQDYVRADGTSHTLKSSVNGGAEVSLATTYGAPAIAVANTNITSTSFVTTGLVFPTIPASTTVHGRCIIPFSQTTAAAGVSFGVGNSAAPTDLQVTGRLMNGTASATSYYFSAGTGPSIIGSSITPAAAATVESLELDLTLINSTSADTVTIYGLTANASDALAIPVGAQCNWLP